MIPLFKSHWSLGQSILTFEESGERPDRSIIDLCLNADIKEVPVVEDSVHGIKQTYEECKNAGLDLRFGWRVNCVDNLNSEKSPSHKIIIFLKNRQGWFDFLPIHNKANTDFKLKKKPRVSLDFLRENWTDNLDLVIPFYDNFIFHNLTEEEKIVVDFSNISPKFIIEDNDFIFDSLIKEHVENYAQTNSYETHKAKSIFYNKREDFDAWLIMKLSTNRKYGGKQSLNVPGRDFTHSREFCFESWLEKAK